MSSTRAVKIIRHVAEPLENHRVSKSPRSGLSMRAVLSSQCLDRRIPDEQTLSEEIAAWVGDRRNTNSRRFRRAEKAADSTAALVARRVASDSRSGWSRSPTFPVW